MKKLTLILAAALMLGSLIACNNTTDTTETTAADTTAATEAGTTAGSDIETITAPTTESNTDPSADATEKVQLTIHVVDQDGNPVAEAQVQVCRSGDSGICAFPIATDASGIAVFEMDAAYTYDAKLTAAPDGYTGDTDAYVAFANNEATITITKS